MKKILMILICLNFGFGFNAKDANQSIDNLAYKSKIMGELINNFLIQNQPKVEAFKNEMIKSFFDINNSINSFGDDLGNELLKMQQKLYKNFTDSDFENLKNSFLNSENTKSTVFIKNTQKNISLDEMKQIININSNLITSASLINENDNTELNLEGNEKLTQNEFEEIAKKSIEIIKQNHKNIKTIRIYYFNEKSKFSKFYKIN
ncbi:hypothetical protein [Campylobacter ureolyticus]|uniref:Uncharacterized protein n=1 Tax=Campylobacter ureolyticus TaxID=827 RepID=A0A9Q4PT56_9BACT|nr:hypothetical protein [Campylobacter ureolyticus]MCZ6159474.1 hypothetical protein [Campylobacter ureolyticus]MCZ6163621.1 hypothetical protein [Campylobacter ureolyticus]MCZ6165297.1 hypothetical protein [Campylobacter ureolyticus]MCZ6166770.1 hypothetical protein [Campylobacter ureolyticus]MCZ6186016.1 hypothetical protein [Campylobacter ureolyticus]